MKKILSILETISLAGTSATSLVACNHVLTIDLLLHNPFSCYKY